MGDVITCTNPAVQQQKLLHAAQVGDVQLARCAQLLSAEEQQYVGKARNADVARERLLARAFLRFTLSQYLPHTPAGQVRGTFKRCFSDFNIQEQ